MLSTRAKTLTQWLFVVSPHQISWRGFPIIKETCPKAVVRLCLLQLHSKCVSLFPVERMIYFDMTVKLNFCLESGFFSGFAEWLPINHIILNTVINCFCGSLMALLHFSSGSFHVKFRWRTLFQIFPVHNINRSPWRPPSLINRNCVVPVSSRRSLSEEPENEVVGIGGGGGGVLQEPLAGFAYF